MRIIEEKDIETDEIISDLRKLQTIVFLLKFIIRVGRFVYDCLHHRDPSKADHDIFDFNIYWQIIDCSVEALTFFYIPYIFKQKHEHDLSIVMQSYQFI